MLIIGTIPIHYYSLIVGLGTAVGLLWSTIRVSGKSEIAQERLNFGVIALAGGLTGGRAVYVCINWVYFQPHFDEIPQLWLGGISWGGALGGSLIALAVSAAILKRPVGIIFDGLLPLLTSLTVSVWLASWSTGHAYGIEVETWWGIPSLDEWGQVATRWPIQLIGAISTLGVHWGIGQIRFRRWLLIPGLAASVQLGLISLIIIVLSPYRADPSPLINNTRLDAWAALGYFIFSFVIGIFFWIKYVRSQPTVQ